MEYKLLYYVIWNMILESSSNKMWKIILESSSKIMWKILPVFCSKKNVEDTSGIFFQQKFTVFYVF